MRIFRIARHRRASGSSTGGGSTRWVAYGALLLIFTVGACGDSERETNSAPGASRSPSDSARVTAAAESLAAAEDEWNTPEVVKRLTEAGLVVVDSGETVRHPALRVEGRRLRVSGSELQLYVYEDADARRQDGVDLDTTRAAANALAPPRELPRFIVVNNLIAIHRTPSERLAERVQDALMARHVGNVSNGGESDPLQ